MRKAGEKVKLLVLLPTCELSSRLSPLLSLSHCPFAAACSVCAARSKGRYQIQQRQHRSCRPMRASENLSPVVSTCVQRFVGGALASRSEILAESIPCCALCVCGANCLDSFHPTLPAVRSTISVLSHCTPIAAAAQCCTRGCEQRKWESSSQRKWESLYCSLSSALLLASAAAMHRSTCSDKRVHFDINVAPKNRRQR
jgi:hypothetical protein